MSDRRKKYEGRSENLKICVRVRPLSSKEIGKRYSRIIDAVDHNMLTLCEEVPTKLDALRENRSREQTFAYDFVFDEKAAQEFVYQQTTKALIKEVIQGYNATVFAYGPTGTGKTYTMVGTTYEPGIMVRALNDLFKEMKSSQETFMVYMSYLEIYNEVIRDLLVHKSKLLDLREDSKTGTIQVAGLSQISTTSTNEVMTLLQKGNERRICEPTAANETSSRSHALLQIHVRLSSHTHSEGELVKMGRLFMVDLAGSERAKNTKNEGKRLQEGAHINKSLLALGNVINALAEGGTNYVNFRDSKLTRLLKDALTGNCKTVMIAHVSPANAHREESRNTLIYADRAKKITTKTRQNKVDISYHISQYQSIISELKEEIRRLKFKLAETQKDEPTIQRKDDKTVKKYKQQLIEAFREYMTLRKKLMEIDNSIQDLSREFDILNDVVSEWENERNKQKQKPRRNSDQGVETDEDYESDENEPEELREAMEDLIYLQKEEKRFAQMKREVLADMDKIKTNSNAIEEVQSTLKKLPSKITDSNQRELLELLCKVHELEIKNMEMESQAILKGHELTRKEFLLLRYESQRSLSEEIITKQRRMLQEGKQPITLEIEELYAQYQMEMQYINRKIHLRLNNREPSATSRNDKLPSIYREPDKLFTMRRPHSLGEHKRSSTPLLLLSPVSSSPRERGTYRRRRSIGEDSLPSGSRETTPRQRKRSDKNAQRDDHFPPI